MIDKKKAAKRYRLNSIIRKQGYKLITRERTIFVPFTQTEFSVQVLKLRDVFGYAIQTEITD